MRYPPPPWRLAGPCATLTGLLPVAVARDLVPRDLHIVELRRGLTMGAIMIADYQDRATFPYSELAVMPAIVRYRGVRGPWISSIWVSSEASLRGGREMWGLHKESAVFDWDFTGRQTTVAVTDADGEVGTWTWEPPRRRIPFPARFSGVGSVDGDRRRYRARGVAHLRRTSVDISAPGAALQPVLEQLIRSVPMAGELDLRFGDIGILAPPP